MALRAFTKVLVKHGKAAFEGLCRKGDGTILKVPKQLPKGPQRLVNLPRKSAKGEPAVRDWVRRYAWETLAADLRRRAAWQVTGSGTSRAFSAGQRWLLFPAYAFVGLSLTAGKTPSLSAEEVDRGFDNVTEQIKGIFGPGPKEAVSSSCEVRTEEWQSGRLIARGPRVALYKVDTTKNTHDASPDASPEPAVETPAPECPSKVTAPEPKVEVAQGQQVDLSIPEPLPTSQPSKVNLNFTTADGKSYCVNLEVLPSGSVPVSIKEVSVDGTKMTLTPDLHASPPQSSEHIEKLLSEAMKEEQVNRESPSRISESYETIPSHERADMMRESYVLPQYESLSESTSFHGDSSQTSPGTPSIEVISESNVSSPVNENLSLTGSNLVIKPPVAESSASTTTQNIVGKETSLDSDIVIIDETVELDLQNQDMDDPIFLDDLEEDPLDDLTFLDENEAMNYLQHGYEGGYLLMTYFPPQDDVTSLSLPDTGENLWDAYEELFLSCGSTPTKGKVTGKTDECNDTASTPAVNSTHEHLVQTPQIVSNVPEGSLQDHMSAALEPLDMKEPRPPDLECSESNESSNVMKVSEYHDAEVSGGGSPAEVSLEPASLNLPPTVSQIWKHRVPSDRVLEPHPNVACLPEHLLGVFPLRASNFEGSPMQNNYTYVSTLSDHLTTHSPGLLESVVLLTQLVDAMDHLNEQTLVYKHLSGEDVLLGSEAKWSPLLVADFGGRLYERYGPRHLSYRDAVVNCNGNCSVVQPEVCPRECEPGSDVKGLALQDLTKLALEIFGCRSPLATNEPLQMDSKLTFPSYTPIIFQRLLQGLVKSDKEEMFDTKMLSSCLHLLLWCPQRYFQTSDPVRAKFLVTRWLATFTAVTLLKKSGQDKMDTQENLKLQMKCVFLSTLDTEKLSKALDFILKNFE